MDYQSKITSEAFMGIRIMSLKVTLNAEEIEFAFIRGVACPFSYHLNSIMSWNQNLVHFGYNGM